MFSKKIIVILLACALVISSTTIVMAASYNTNVVKSANSLANNKIVQGTFRVPALSTWTVRVVAATSGSGTGGVTIRLLGDSGNVVWQKNMSSSQSGTIWKDIKLSGGLFGQTFSWSVTNISGAGIGYSIQIDR